MHSDAHNSYLESQVLTATPQKQRLMLIDGAMRFARQAMKLWEDNQEEQATEALESSRKIVSELLSSIDVQQDDLTQKVAAIYVFIFQKLAEAQWARSTKALQEVLDILAVERETWQLLCEQMPEAPVPNPNQRIDSPQEILAPNTSSFADADVKSGSFSLDA